MQSVISRPQMLAGSSSANPHRVPRKSISYMSLRREKDKPTAVLDPYAQDSSGPSKQTYFDVYPRPSTSPNTRPSKSKTRETRRTSPSRTDPPSRKSPGKIRKEQDVGETYAFPSFETSDDGPFGGDQTPKLYSRTRSRTGPSSRPKWSESSVPTLRFSGSSSQTRTDPPHTPIDITSFRGSYEEFPFVVAAPVSGVESMDALVDGMNGGDDIIGGGTSLSNRARFGIPGHHPLYLPPLPTPPPGVVLGGGKIRRRKEPQSGSSGDEDDTTRTPTRSRRQQSRRPTSSRTTSNSTITVSTHSSHPPRDNSTPSPTNSDPFTRPLTTFSLDKRKSVAPSISEIIRIHAPSEGQVRSRPSTARNSSVYAHSHGHGTVQEEPESEPEALGADEEADMLSRSSIDSIADEVQRTLRNQTVLKPAPPLQPAHFLNKRMSVVSDCGLSILSPRSEPYTGTSIYSSSASSYCPPHSPLSSPTFITMNRPTTPSQAVAQYLRSPRLTTLLKLTRSPHASLDNPLTVSLSDLGSPSGIPVIVFLGLGCVRHIMGLYDEMAECLGLRLITIDRWGLGRTEPREKTAKGIIQWASVVEEILDLLHIQKCSVMAHSAGAPYALSFANKLRDRIHGEICLLAPWVGGSEGGSYKWLKYVPNGILKTAQAAEWKVQAWMIGKPPTIAWEGIGYDAQTHSKSMPNRHASPPQKNNHTSSAGESRPRPSMASSNFSEYDDLEDFDGRFESRSTLGAESRSPPRRAGSESKISVNKRKTSKGFLERLNLKGSSSSSQPQSPTESKPTTGRRLKALRSMGSLKGKSASSSPTSYTASKKWESPGSLPISPPLQFEMGLGLEDLSWMRSLVSEGSSTTGEPFPSTPEKHDSPDSHGLYARSGGRRSISFTSARTTTLSIQSSPVPSTPASPLVSSAPGNGYQITLGNALIAASHSESAKGTHNDLLQILNHENHSWGFSYSAYPHKVRVWYGDHDEKIAENAVRWMERNMGEDRCSVKVVKGADHGLMYKSSVVVEVLERIREFW